MLELDGIATVRRPDGSRWNDGALFRYSVRLIDFEANYELVEEAPIEEIQSYPRFQAFVAREFGVWYRYPPAEDHATGTSAWSEHIAERWGRAATLAYGDDAGDPVG